MTPDLGLLLLGFFAWQFIRQKQRQEEEFAPSAQRPSNETTAPTPVDGGGRSARDASRPAGRPEKDTSAQEAKEHSKSEMTPEMIERMKRARAEKEAARGGTRAENPDKSTSERDAKPSDEHRTVPDSKKIPPEMPEKMRRAQGAREAQRAGSDGGHSRELSKSDMTPEMIERMKRARAAKVGKTGSESGRSRELSRADMTPEMLEQMRKARDRREGEQSTRQKHQSGHPGNRSPSSRSANESNESAREGAPEKARRLRPQDMTPEEREKYMEEYRKMKEEEKREAERAAKERRGEGSSGLSFEEKESLSAA